MHVSAKAWGTTLGAEEWVESCDFSNIKGGLYMQNEQCSFEVRSESQLIAPKVKSLKRNPDSPNDRMDAHGKHQCALLCDAAIAGAMKAKVPWG